jgi:dUTP pyrophosphatase
MIEVLVDGPVPQRAVAGDAAADLVAAEAATLAPGQRATVGTGLRIALPAGTAALVLPRSGLAAKHGITVVNAPGLIDAGYRGEIRVTLLNTDPATSYDVAIGDRIAQLLVLPLPEVRFVPVERLPGSHRGAGGFGSTGTGAPPAAGRGSA